MSARTHSARVAFGIVLIMLIVGVAVIVWHKPEAPQPQDAVPAGLDCPRDLHGFVRCVRQHMPRQDSIAAFVAPDARALGSLTAAAAALASRAGASCEVALPAGLSERYQSVDLKAGDKRYCALWEAHLPERASTLLGWGSLVVNRAPQRALVMGAPHPLFDMGTLEQSLELFVELDAHAFVIAGSHRHAARTRAGCQRYAPSDATHNLSGYFALASGVTGGSGVRAQSNWFLEWHGMNAAQPTDPCYDATRNRPVDVYITEGSSRRLTDDGFAARLTASLRARQPDWRVATPDDGIDCDKSGATNVLGQFLNQGFSEPLQVQECGVQHPFRNRVTGRFVHIEQLRCARGFAGGLDCSGAQGIRSADRWVQAIMDAYQPTAGEGAGMQNAY